MNTTNDFKIQALKVLETLYERDVAGVASRAELTMAAFGVGLQQDIDAIKAKLTAIKDAKTQAQTAITTALDKAAVVAAMKTALAGRDDKEGWANMFGTDDRMDFSK